MESARNADRIIESMNHHSICNDDALFITLRVLPCSCKSTNFVIIEKKPHAIFSKYNYIMFLCLCNSIIVLDQTLYVTFSLCFALIFLFLID